MFTIVVTAFDPYHIKTLWSLMFSGYKVKSIVSSSPLVDTCILSPTTVHTVSSSSLQKYFTKSQFNLNSQELLQNKYKLPKYL